MGRRAAIALAALAATGAFAQSTVTITGGVSMGFQQSTVRKDTGASAGQITRIAGADAVTGNSIYFTAVEDLGGGLKVTGQIQQRLSAGAGTAAAAPSDNQNAPTTGTGVGDLFVQVDGGFGTIKAGRFTFASNAGYNAFGVRAITGQAVTAAAGGMGGDNTVTYTTPSFGGLKVALGFSTAGTKAGQDPAIGLKLNYDAGPLAVQFAHTTSINGADTSGDVALNGGLTLPSNSVTTAVNWSKYPATGRVTVDTVAANYDFGMAKLSAAYFRRTADAPLTTPATPDANGYTVGLAVPMGAATFKAAVMNNSKTDLLLDRASYGVDYALSKRTTLIAEYARDKQALTGATATNNYFIGVAHTF